MGTPAYLIDGPEDLQRSWFETGQTVGITAGASAPEHLVQAVAAAMQEWGGERAVELDGRRETITFSLPKELRIPVTNLI